MKATRDGYGDALLALGEKHDFYVLDADLSKSTKTGVFKEKYPNRFFNAGIAEANLFGMSAGFAASGKTVFASTFAMFAAGRGYEQIRNSIAYTNLNVKIGATHAGILIGEDGGSHQMIEDVSLMRTIPNMTVICPSDYVQAKAATEAALLHDGPVYLRFGRNASTIIYDAPEYEIGKGYVLKEGKDITIIAMGDMVYESLLAAKELENDGISAAVIDMPSIKPIDRELVVRYAKATNLVLTVEDHNIIGGLGSAVCEVLAEEYPARVIRTGVADVFGRSGNKKELEEYFGLNSKSIRENVLKAVKL